MSKELVKTDQQQVALQRAESLSRVLISGDLSRLTEDEKGRYYLAICEATGLNPMAQPFGFIRTQNGLIIYAKKSATEQLRKRDNVSVKLVRSQTVEGVYEVVAQATTPDGREDTDVGAVNIEGLKGEARANAIMKATTKAKRRVTLSICGLGMLDESEVDSIPGAVTIQPPAINGKVQAPAPAPVQAVEGEMVGDGDHAQSRVERVMEALHSVKQQWQDSNCKARVSKLIGRTLTGDAAISELTEAETEKVVAYCAEYRAKLDSRKKSGSKSQTANPDTDKPPATAERQDAAAKQITRETIGQILAEVDRIGKTWPQTRGAFWPALGVAEASAISGVDSLSQQQGELLLSILRVQPTAEKKGAAA